jgi:dTDP-4-amino-4,6-dideoxygalactose transaminase
LPQKNQWTHQVYHLFVIRAKKRGELKAYLSGHGIETGIHYPIALPKLKAYDYLGQGSENFSANRKDASLLSLPIGEQLEEKDVEQAVETIKGFYAHFNS